MRRPLLLLLVILPGLAVILVCGWFLIHDWATLNRAYGRFEGLARSGAELRALFVAEAYQNTFRLNCFAEGIGVLLGAILAAIGLHGLCLMPPRRSLTAAKQTHPS